MVIDEGRNVTVIPYFHEGICFVPLSVIHYTVQVMHKASYPEVYFLDKDKKNAAVNYTWKNFTSETNQDKWIST